MSPLTFGQQADTYLEWAHATQYHWVSPHLSSQVDVLSDDGHSIKPHRVAHGTLPAANRWAELAHAITPMNRRPNIPREDKEGGSGKRGTVVGLIDSGIGRAWLAQNTGFKVRATLPNNDVMHWDMDLGTPSPHMPRVSHGAHVLSWLAGQPPYPGGGFGADPGSAYPLILVNLPRDAVDDPTGRWLGRYILDGLD